MAASNAAVPQKCGAKKANSDGRCSLPAGYGTGHPGVGPCKWHFGATPVIEKRYAISNLRHQCIEIMQELDVKGWAEDLDPGKVLADELRRSYILIHVMESQISLEDVLWPDMHKMLLDERKHSVDVAAKMITLGLAEREVRVLEAEAMMFAQSIRTILDRLELTDEQRHRAPEIVRTVLAALPAA